MIVGTDNQSADADNFVHFGTLLADLRRMTARYALMSLSSDPMDQDTFARAFRGVPGLAPVDANLIGHPESGMPVRKLTLQQATALQSNLKGLGVTTEVVSETALPTLPEPKPIDSLEFSAETLILRDSLQRRTELGRGDLNLLAAGSVRVATFSRQRSEKQEFRAHMIHFSFHPVPLMIPVMRSETRVQYVARESDEWVLRAEIISLVSNQRFVIEGRNFDYGCLGSAMTQELATNFCLLIRELAGKCSTSVMSRGLGSILADPPEFVYYSNKDAFQNELVWLLWREKVQSPATHG